MKTIIAPFVFLLICLYAQSMGESSADADYCIKFSNLNPVMSLVKEYRVLDPMLLDIQQTLKCIDGKFDTTVYFELIEEKSGIRRFETWSPLPTVKGVIEFSKTCYGIKSRQVPLIDDLSPIIQIYYPPTSGPILPLSEYSQTNEKKGLLSFNNKIIDAEIRARFNCPPHLDTTFRIDFRARITGECK